MPLAARKTRRGAKLLSRLLPAALLALALGAGLRCDAPVLVGIALAGIACATLFLLAYRRRGPDRTPCATCPERLGDQPCRGFAEIVRRERAAQRLSGRWISLEIR